MSWAISTPLPDTDAVEVILDALRRAAEAHGIHEAEVLGGEYDTRWPEWYARHIARTLDQGGYTILRTTE